MIRLEAVSKIYQMQDFKIYALRNICWRIRQGTAVGVIGHSGAGKTTLLRLLSGQEVPTEGKIWQNEEGKETAYLSNARGKRTAVLFQDYPLLWSKTVEQNLALLLEISGTQKQAVRRRIKNLLQAVQLEGAEKNYLQQLDGLGRQKLALACALLREPEMLLCDETRLRLEPSLKEKLFVLLGDLQARRHFTLIYFTYSSEVMKKYCTEGIVLKDGEILAQGKPQQILAENFF